MLSFQLCPIPTCLDLRTEFPNHQLNIAGASSSELAGRLQEAENAAAEEERQEGTGGGGHGQAQGQHIGPRSNKDKKVKKRE